MQKTILAAAACVLLQAATAQAAAIDIGGSIQQLKFSDFSAVREDYANTQAVVAYETTLDVSGDVGSTVIFEVGGEVTTRWFAGNLVMNMTVTCLSPRLSLPLLIGTDTDTGIRFEHQSYKVRPEISVEKNTGGDCQQLHIRLDKVGPLSRKFYTVVTDLQFRVHLLERHPG